jgi:hypothetical protein
MDALFRFKLDFCRRREIMFTEKPRLYWYSTNCLIEGDIVFEVDHHNRVTYNAFEKSDLLYEFISIDENNPDSIKEFIEKYGFLRAEFDKEIGSVKKTDEGWVWDKPYSENLTNIQDEISTLKAVNTLHSVYNSGNPLKTLIENWKGTLTYTLILSKLISRNSHYLEIEYNAEGVVKDIFIKPQEYFEGYENSTKPNYNEIDVKVSAAIILKEILNEKIEHAKPVLDLDINFKLYSSWYIESLIDLIYIQFYDTLLSGEELRLCENERCKGSKYFKTQIGKDKRFCCRACAVQGMQNEANRSLKNPLSDKYDPKKIAFKKVYGRLYYLDYKKSIDTAKFKTWNGKARENLKTMSEPDFLSWLENTGKEENFIKNKEANQNER